MAVLDAFDYSPGQIQVGLFQGIRNKLEGFLQREVLVVDAPERLDEHGVSLQMHRSKLQVLQVQYQALMQYDFKGSSCHGCVLRILSSCRKSDLMDAEEIHLWGQRFGIPIAQLD